jgi:hypothetical protein
MSHLTEFEQFITSCSDSPIITVEFLETNQPKYNFLENSILDLLCANRYLTHKVLQWLLSNYPDSISDNHLKKILKN